MDTAAIMYRHCWKPSWGGWFKGNATITFPSQAFPFFVYNNDDVRLERKSLNDLSDVL